MARPAPLQAGWCGDEQIHHHTTPPFEGHNLSAFAFPPVWPRFRRAQRPISWRGPLLYKPGGAVTSKSTTTPPRLLRAITYRLSRSRPYGPGSGERVGRLHLDGHQRTEIGRA